MSQRKYWRKYIILSLCIHALMFFFLGYIAPRLSATADPTESYLELALADTSEVSIESQDFSADAGAATLPAANPSASPRTPAVSRLDSAEALQTFAPQNTASTSMNEPPSTAVSGIPAAAASSGNIDGNADSLMSPNGSDSAAGSNRPAGDGGIIPPGVLMRIDPEYPLTARQENREGTVILKVQIRDNGYPGTITIVQSSGHDSLDDAAIKAVRQWRFSPAKNRSTGQPVISYTRIPLSFHLQ